MKFSLYNLARCAPIAGLVINDAAKVAVTKPRIDWNESNRPETRREKNSSHIPYAAPRECSSVTSATYA